MTTYNNAPIFELNSKTSKAIAQILKFINEAIKGIIGSDALCVYNDIYI